jgi:asparagine synthase (glutamine-hydrolysing)
VRRYVRRANRRNPERVFSYNLLLSQPLTALLAPDFLASVDPHALLAPAVTAFDALRDASELNRLLHLDLKLAIADNDVRKVSGTADLAGIAVRYPFLDTQLAELTGRIPSHLKLRGCEKRYIFKRALADFLPPQILAKAKHGFGVPVASWMKSDPAWSPMVADLLHDARTRQRGYLLPQVLDSVWQQHHVSESAYYGDMLWPVLMLELWHRAHAAAVTS